MNPIQANADQMARRARPWLVWFARCGFAARGVVYAIVGIFAALTPIGLSAGPTGTSGALQSLLHEPAGWVLLWAVAIGLLGWSCWQIIRAVHDPEGAGTSPGGICRRIAWGFSAIIELAVAAGVAALALGWKHASQDSGDTGVHDWTGWAMSYPFGRIIVAAVGAGICAFGIAQIGLAVFGHLGRYLDLSHQSERLRTIILGIGRFGVAARGTVFVLAGGFLMRSAFHANAAQAHGLGGTLRVMAAEPYGRWLLGLCALGLMAYGAYELALAWYRRIRVE